jgi:hypothetical protein
MPPFPKRIKLEGGELLRTDGPRDPCHISVMTKKKVRKQIANEIIARVNEEMQRPRLTESVRNAGQSQHDPVARSSEPRSEKV